jgi:hypothetical protein
VSLPAESLKYLSLRSTERYFAILEHVHLGLPLLLGLQRIDYLVRIDSGKLISKTLHELVAPVFFQVPIKGTRLVRGLGLVFFLKVLT